MIDVLFDDALVAGSTMTSVYDLLRQRCGLSQTDAAEFHETRIDTIKSWCSDRRSAPLGAIDELRDLYADIAEAGRELADIVRLMPTISDDKGAPYFQIGTPVDRRDAVVCGFPSEGSCLAAVALAIAELPHPTKIVPRERWRNTHGRFPTEVAQRSRHRLPFSGLGPAQRQPHRAGTQKPNRTDQDDRR